MVICGSLFRRHRQVSVEISLTAKISADNALALRDRPGIALNSAHKPPLCAHAYTRSPMLGRVFQQGANRVDRLFVILDTEEPKCGRIAAVYRIPKVSLRRAVLLVVDLDCCGDHATGL